MAYSEQISGWKIDLRFCVNTNSIFINLNRQYFSRYSQLGRVRI